MTDRVLGDTEYLNELLVKKTKMSDVFRKQYRELTDSEKVSVEKIKTLAEDLMAEFDKAIPKEERSDRSRYMSLARTELELTIMWAVKGITL